MEIVHIIIIVILVALIALCVYGIISIFKNVRGYADELKGTHQSLGGTKYATGLIEEKPGVFEKFPQKVELMTQDMVTSLPEKVDHRPNMPPIRDQGDLGSCTAFAITSVYMYNCARQDIDVSKSSPLFVYYVTRDLMGDPSVDSGGAMSDTIKAITETGIAPESCWKYSDRGIKFTEEPPAIAYERAENHRAIKAYGIRNTLKGQKHWDQTKEINSDYSDHGLTTDKVKYVLNEGNVIIMGIVVCENWSETGEDGIIPDIPDWGYVAPYRCGGHAVVICGYDDTKGCFIIHNSWGDTWGDKGYGYLRYDHMKYSMDLWVVELVSNDSLGLTAKDECVPK